MNKVFGRPASLTRKTLSYCPGCTHGIVHRLVAECLDEMEARDRTIGVAPVGCAVFAYDFFDLDMHQAAHGRAPAVATGIKRVLPDRIVFAYQGDGDLASIGMAEIVHAAARGEKITVVFINNAIYGMTGGQMAPTTLVGQKTTTSPAGRDPEKAGYPIRVCELLATLPGAVYLARVSVHNPKNVLAAKAAIKRAFAIQEEGRGFSLVEVLSSCPTNWGMTPIEALKWIEEKMIPYYPLGTFRQPEEATNVGA
ncbi:MAG: thiamine pyrophosphate-dependent enzyme [Bacteroidota bacterium]